LATVTLAPFPSTSTTVTFHTRSAAGSWLLATSTLASEYTDTATLNDHGHWLGVL
jgi:hypothetical protein